MKSEKTVVARIVIGYLLPVALSASGIGLMVTLQAPEPEKSRMADPNKLGELLQYLPAAQVAEVRMLNEPLLIQASGTVVPFREVQLAAQVAGRVVQKDPIVRSGNYVEQGQELYRIDPRDYELEIERLERRREQELAFIEELKLEIENANNLLEVAEDQLKLALADVQRFEKMSNGFSSAAELDDARRALLSSRNQKVTLQNQRNASEKRRSRLELAVRLVETELEQAKINLKRTMIASPVSGRIVSEEVEEDSFVQVGRALTVIEDTSKVEVACNIRMDQLSWILEQPNVSADRLVNAAQRSQLELPKTSVQVSFRVSGRESEAYTWTGRLDRIDGTGLDPQSRTVPIRIVIDEPSVFTSSRDQTQKVSTAPLLVRGMFVDVVVEATPATPLVLVPKQGIKPANDANIIWKFQENEDVIRSSDKAQDAIAAYKEAEEAGTVDEIYGEDAANPSSKSIPNPDEWDAGNLKIVEQVRTVRAYWGEGDYWVCEVSGTELEPGDLVVISPLPGIKADGTDAIRVPSRDVRSAGEELAGTDS